MSYRGEGNIFFKNNEYEKAIEQYTLGIENKEEDLHLLLCNRSHCYYNLERYEESLKDCVELCKIKNTWHKAWFRLYLVLDKLGKHEESNKAKKRYSELILNEFKDNDMMDDNIMDDITSKIMPLGKDYLNNLDNYKNKDENTDEIMSLGKAFLNNLNKNNDFDENNYLNTINDDPNFMNIFSNPIIFDLVSKLSSNKNLMNKLSNLKMNEKNIMELMKDDDFKEILENILNE